MIGVNCDSIPEWMSNALVSMGFHGIPGDGAERIYIPTSAIVAAILFVMVVSLSIVMLVQNDRELRGPA
jgi:hypothetical protein